MRFVYALHAHPGYLHWSYFSYFKICVSNAFQMRFKNTETLWCETGNVSNAFRVHWEVCKNNSLFPIELQCMVNLYYLNMPHFSGSHKILSNFANSSSLFHGKTLFCFCITSTKLMIWALMISPHLSIPIMQFYLSCRLE